MKVVELIVVGKLYEKLNTIAETNLPLMDIFCSEGLKIHMEKSGHSNCINYIEKISKIILAPDFVGHNPNEPDSIELIKIFEDNILVAIKLDKKKNYLYVASMYDISNGKLERRLNSGRLKNFN